MPTFKIKSTASDYKNITKYSEKNPRNLSEITKKNANDWLKNYKNRKHDTIINRLRIGHRQ